MESERQAAAAQNDPQIAGPPETVEWIDGPAMLPAPEGGTDLTGALELASQAWPSEVLVISDGLPADEAGALKAAELIPGTISVLFVGSDDDQRGLEFLRRLAAVGGGIFARKDLSKHMEIGTELREMLALPPPIAL